jgi:hypothetical protein
VAASVGRLVAQTDELAAVDGARDATGDGNALALVGEPRIIGSTRLLSELASRADA